MKATTTMTMIATLLLAAQSASAADMAGMKMSGTAAKPAAPASKSGKGTGIITAMDMKAATVTIKHGPIPAVNWPAMTMTFKATPASLLKKVKVGQTIGFDVTTHGMAADVTAIRPQ